MIRCDNCRRIFCDECSVLDSGLFSSKIVCPACGQDDWTVIGKIENPEEDFDDDTEQSNTSSSSIYMNVQDVISFFENEGLQCKSDYTSSGARILRLNQFGNRLFSFRLRTFDKDKDKCWGGYYTKYRSTDESLSVTEINRRNMKSSWGRRYIDDENDFVLEFDVILEGGSRQTLKESFRIWKDLVEKEFG